MSGERRAPTDRAISRRHALSVMAGGAAGIALLPGLLARPAGAIGVLDGAALRPADANGWRLLPGFTSRVVATTGQAVGASAVAWHPNPDGAAVFPDVGGGWFYVSNNEHPTSGQGGVSRIRFDAAGAPQSARVLLSGTTLNCNGGATPWGTWLSAEEIDRGQVFEVDPTGARAPVARPALGRFQHEAVAVNPDRRELYLTEDNASGGLYRFRPTTWGDLSAGVLSVLCEGPSGRYWATVPDPSGSAVRTRQQVAAMKRFNGGEGIWYARGLVYFTTKGDNRVWVFDPVSSALDVLYEPATNPNPQLRGVDTLVVAPWGDLLVAEDGDDMQVIQVSRTGVVRVLAMLTGVSGSELTGLAFDPSGTRLYVSSQRNPGRTYEITGPFPGAARRVEETAPELVWSPGWSTWTDASQSGGSSRFTATVGASVTVVVTGPLFTWIGQRGPGRGRAEVRIDGALVQTVDTWSATWQNQRALFSTSDLSAGNHTVTITFVGGGPSVVGVPGIVVDAIEAVGLAGAAPVVQRFEEDRFAGGFAGSWFRWSHPDQSGGAAQVGTGVGSSLTVTITGSVFRLIGQRGPARAKADIVIDGAPVTTIDTYAPSYASRQVLHAIDNLSNGPHTVRIAISGANPAATGTPALLVDAIEAYGLA